MAANDSEFDLARRGHGIQGDADQIMREVFKIITARGNLSSDELSRAIEECEELDPDALYATILGPAVDEIEAGILFHARHRNEAP